jgi:tetratricopeptide (TPR) repeat protein
MELIESLPVLDPLLPLSPALPLVAQLIDASRDWIAGRGRESLTKYSDALQRISQPDRAGLEPEHYERIRLSVHHALALIEATLGLEGAEERAKIMEQSRGMRVAAWRVRMLVRLSQGDLDGARKCLRRSELLQLQDGAESYHPGSSAGFELISCSLAGDLLGVKTAVDGLSALADQHAGWRPMLMLGQSRYRELQGDLQGALDILEAGLEIAAPGRHAVYPMLAASLVRVMRARGELEQALRQGEEHGAICTRERLTPANRELHLELAQALAEAGQHERALQLIEPWLLWAREHGVTGLTAGHIYEARARVALSMQDRAAFEDYCERCAEEYRRGSNPALSALYARLIDDSSPQTFGLAVSSEPGDLLHAQQLEAEQNSVHSRLLECVDRSDRARCALTMLLQSCESFQGYLYGLDGDELQPLAGLPELSAEPALQTWLENWVAAERTYAAQLDAETGDAVSQKRRSAEGESTATGSIETESQVRHDVPSEFMDSEGRQFWAALLVADAGRHETVAGVVALHVTSPRQPRPRYALLTEIASQMIDRGDVDGAPLS